MNCLAPSTLAFALALAAVGGGLAACSDAHDDGDAHDAHDHDGHGDEGYDGPASCQAFHDACVLAASAENTEATACEEVTHEEGVTEARCAEVRDGCVAACGASAPMGAGGAGDGGAADAVSEAG